MTHQQTYLQRLKYADHPSTGGAILGTAGTTKAEVGLILIIGGIVYFFGLTGILIGVVALVALFSLANR